MPQLRPVPRRRVFIDLLNKGESWEKQNDYISGGTGPHYYQEIEVSQEDSDLIYQMDVFIHVSRDGGNSFNYLGTGREKHSDNHALWIDPHNGQHLLAGTDAGLYESFDEGTTWRHFPNLPISQFYKLGLDQAEPFYNIVGGAQDSGNIDRTLSDNEYRREFGTKTGLCRWEQMAMTHILILKMIKLFIWKFNRDCCIVTMHAAKRF